MLWHIILSIAQAGNFLFTVCLVFFYFYVARNSDETKFQNSLKDIELKLDTSRINEVQLHREIEHHCLQTSQLKASLEESQQNLQIAMAKIDSLSLQCTEQIEQETQVKVEILIHCG